jgi:hypothetical protein
MTRRTPEAPLPAWALDLVSPENIQRARSALAARRGEEPAALTDALLTRPESAEVGRFCVRMLDRAIAERSLAVVRQGRRVFIPRLELARFIAARASTAIGAA